MNYFFSVAIVATYTFTVATLATYINILFMLSSYKYSDGKNTKNKYTEETLCEKKNEKEYRQVIRRSGKGL